MKTLKLPIPPSVNAAYGNRKSGKGPGRYKTRSYKRWIGIAGIWLMSAGMFKRGNCPLVDGPASIVLRLPVNIRGDIDNRLKVAIDYMVSRQFTLDDSTHRSVTACKDPKLGRAPFCEIDIAEAA